jgi:hypothetical protein
MHQSLFAMNFLLTTSQQNNSPKKLKKVKFHIASNVIRDYKLQMLLASIDIQNLDMSKIFVHLGEMKNITKVLKLFFLNLILKFTIKIFYKF